MLRVGIALPNQAAPGRPLANAVNLCVESTRMARDLGYDAVLAGQHYLSDPYPYCSPVPLLARVASGAGRMDLVAVELLALHQPVAVAEEIATLAAGCEGRVVVAAALGYRDIELAAFGVERSERVARFVEALTLLEQLLHDDIVEHHGTFFDVPPSPVCTRSPATRVPAIWLAGSAEAGVCRAARMGHPWLAEPASRLVTLVELGRLYRETLEGAAGGADAAATSSAEVPVIREVFVDESRSRARELAGSALMARYATYARWGHERDLGGGDRFGDAFDELAAGRFIVGDPAECTELVQETVETLGITTLFCHSHWPGFPAEETLRSQRLFAESVRPRL